MGGLLLVVFVRVLRDFDLQVFERGSHMANLLQVLFRGGGDLLHVRQIAFCYRFLDGRSVGNYGRTFLFRHVLAPWDSAFNRRPV
jgi:hypothetical protein